MSSFSSWARRLQRHLRDASCELKLSQAQEVLASGLGHNTLASFQQADLAALDRAYRIVLAPEFMRARTVRFGFDVHEEVFLQFEHDCCTGPDADRRIMATGYVPYLARLALMDVDHPLRHQFAQSQSGMLENTQCSDAEPLLPLDNARGGWEWSVTGSLHCADDRTGWALPVKGRVRFPLLGRRLLGPGEIVALEACGQPFEDDRFELDGGDVYWHDNSD